MLLKIHLFLLLLFIPTSISLSSSSYINYTALDADNNNREFLQNITCEMVPYPFGTVGIALPGFEIDCPKDKPPSGTIPSLFISNNKYTIQEISLQGYIRIYTGLIHKRCRGANGKWNESDGSGRFNLDGTPFTLSYQFNMLTVVGCNNLVSINGKNLAGTSGCVTFCDPQNTFSRSCSGLYCCQATLPGNLKSFDLHFTPVNISNSSAVFNKSCSAAFFAQRDDFLSNLGEDLFQFQGYDIYDQDYSENNLVQLDWAIGNKSCEDSRNDIGSFACKHNSYCYDPPSMDGYLCNCREGYEGNPYAEDGCTDIDECLELDPCVGRCINLPGNYTCSCPNGMTSDGKNGGSECKRTVFQLEIALGAGLGLLFILVMSSFFSYWGLQKRKIVKIRTQFFRKNGGYLLQQRLASQGIDSETKIFTEKELEKATENYNESNILGEEGFGTVYKGTLSDLKVVAIKKSKIENESQIEQFINEIIILSQINHRNVVKLLGCCLETQVPLLVYEFIPNGTLLQLIRTSEFHLTWDCRLRISAEAAGALAYLHSAASIPIIHRDIKSSNILLDKNFIAKVSDFGASRSVPFDKTHLTTLVQGTIGYLDPEYFYTSQLTEKSDVYSFGVVLAELLTGEKPISFARSEEFHNLAMYFTVAFDEGRLLQVVDPPIVNEAGAEELYIMARLTRQCLSTKGEKRPMMKEVALELEALRRMRNQQKQRANEEIQQLLVVGNLSSSDIVECMVPKIGRFRVDSAESDRNRPETIRFFPS